LRCRGIINTFGVYQEYYEADLLKSQSSSNISWIGTLQGFLLFLVGILTGPIFDRGYFRQLILSGTFLVVFGMMMTSLGKSYWQIILAQGICVGVGAGCLFVPSVAIVATYFTTKRALMTGITAAGGSIGRVLLCLLPSEIFQREDCRRCHLRYRLPQATANPRLRLGHTQCRLHGIAHAMHQSGYHALTYYPAKESSSAA